MVVFERTNARYLTKEQINVLVDLITIDVSFISLRKILVPLVSFLKEGGSIVALIKPQFEAGKTGWQKRCGERSFSSSAGLEDIIFLVRKSLYWCND